MALIKESYIEELKEHAIDHVDSIFGEATQLKKSGKNLVGLCMFHEEKSPSFHVDINRGSYHCFGCGEKGGHALKFIMEYYKLPFPEAVDRLAKLTNFKPIEYEEGSPAPKKNSQAPRIKSALAHANRMFQEQLAGSNQQLQYLNSRGFTDEDIKRFNIGFAPNSFDFLPKQLIKQVGVKALQGAGLVSNKDKRIFDFFRNRIMFPVRDTNGLVVAFGGRTRLNNPLEVKKAGKYINSPDTELFTKGKHLYGLYESLELRSPEPGTFNMMEGYVDVVAAHRHGYSNTVAPMGTAVTVEQLTKLFKYCDHVRFIFDGDKAGYKAAYEASVTMLSLSSGSKTASVVILPRGEDPDSYLAKQGGKNLFSQAISKDVPISKFLVDYLQHRYGNASVEDRTTVSHHAKKLVELTVDPTYKEFLKLELNNALDLRSDWLWNDHPSNEKVWFEQLDTDERTIIKNASQEVIAYCGLVLTEPEWLKMFPLNPEDSSNPSDQELIKFTNYTLENSSETNTSPDRFYKTNLAALVKFMKAKVSPSLENKINVARAYGLGGDIDQEQSSTVQLDEKRMAM